MIQDLNFIDQAIGLFQEDAQGLHLTSKFLDIGYSLRFNDYFTDQQRTNVEVLFRHAWQDIQNISVLIERIEWVKLEAINGKITDDKWREYTRLDVEHFHTELRSLMDYVNEIISYFSKMQGQWPGSFNRMTQRIDNFRRKMHPEVYEEIIGTHWFHDIRYVRDSLIHYGGNSLIFGKPDEGVLFQIYDSKNSNLINKNFILYNENVAYFEKYAVLYLSKVLVFLDNLGGFYLNLLGIEMKLGGVRSYASGYVVTHSWLSVLKNELKEMITKQNV